MLKRSRACLGGKQVSMLDHFQTQATWDVKRGMILHLMKSTIKNKQINKFLNKIILKIKKEEKVCMTSKMVLIKIAQPRR